MHELAIPEIEQMSDHEIHDWFATLSKETVYANLTALHRLVTRRFGQAARVVVATYQPPRIIEIVDEQIA